MRLLLFGESYIFDIYIHFAIIYVLEISPPAMKSYHMPLSYFTA